MWCLHICLLTYVTRSALFKSSSRFKKMICCLVKSRPDWHHYCLRLLANSHQRPVPLLGGMEITVFDGKGYFSYQVNSAVGLVSITLCLNSKFNVIFAKSKPKLSQNCIQFQFMGSRFFHSSLCWWVLNLKTNFGCQVKVTTQKYFAYTTARHLCQIKVKQSVIVNFSQRCAHAHSLYFFNTEIYFSFDKFDAFLKLSKK